MSRCLQMCHGADHRLHLWVFQGELWTYGEHPACRRRIGDSGASHFRLARLSPNLSTPDAGATALRSGLVLVQLAQARMATSRVTPSLQQERDAEGSVPRWSRHACFPFCTAAGMVVTASASTKEKEGPKAESKGAQAAQRSAASCSNSQQSQLMVRFSLWDSEEVVVAR